LVWPGVFLGLVLHARGAQHRKALAGALSLIIAASLIWSLIQTAVNRTWAYFSQLTLAWELALGASRLGANHRTAETCVGATGSGFRLVGRNRPLRSAFHLGHSLPRICVTLPVVGSPVLIAAGCANQTNDRWGRPVGAANAVGRCPVLLHVSLALASSHHPPRNAAYSIGTSSSLRRYP
jgi:peptidoglycan/LPS O-acetylase OafA/YrhL